VNGHRDTEPTEMKLPQSHGATEINALTRRIIGSAIEVHRVLGRGLLESLYESALCIEFDDIGLKCARQVRAPAYDKGRLLGEYRVDLIVEELVLLEIKSVEPLDPVFDAHAYLPAVNRKEAWTPAELQLTSVERWDSKAGLVVTSRQAGYAGRWRDFSETDSVAL